MRKQWFLLSFWLFPFFCLADASKQSICPVHSVLFVGDSITRHGEQPSIGWLHTAGMAASTSEKDYVHLFLDDLTDNYSCGPVDFDINTAGGAGALNDRVDSTIALLKKKKYSLVVVQLGEHDVTPNGAADFRARYKNFLRLIKSEQASIGIACIGLWMPYRSSEENKKYTGIAADYTDAISSACRESNGVYVDVSDIAGDLSKRGSGESNGVKWHPNDQAHKIYAQRLMRSFKQLNIK